MGKKRISLIGDVFEEENKRQKRTVQREQKAIREGKKIESDEQTKLDHPQTNKHSGEVDVTKVSGMKGGERIKDTSAESLQEFERLQQKQHAASNQTVPEKTVSSKIKSKRQRSIRYIKSKKQIKENQNYSIEDAVANIRKLNLTKFTSTVELNINLFKQDSFTNQTVELPHSLGRTQKVAILNEKIMEQLGKGQIDFDILLAKPSDMASLVKYAKILGPKGLMPNPKNGTITENPQEALQKLTTGGRLEIKIEKKAPLIHTIAGKLSMKDDQLITNINSIINFIGTKNIQKVFISTTMSPSLRLNISN